MERRNAILSLVIAAIIIVGFLIGFLYADMGWRTSPFEGPLNKTKVETPRPTPRLPRGSRRTPKRIPRCRISNSRGPSGRNTNRGEPIAGSVLLVMSDLRRLLVSRCQRSGLFVRHWNLPCGYRPFLTFAYGTTPRSGSRDDNRPIQLLLTDPS